MKAGIYQHYKGAYYQVFGIAADSTNEGSIENPNHETRRMVVYLSFNLTFPGPRLRVRDYKEFTQRVTWPDGGVRSRFVYIGDEIPRG